MSSDRLHEAINAVIIDQTWATYERGNQDPVVAGTGLAVDAILAMPEMQAIRRHLQVEHLFDSGGNPRDVAWVRRIMAVCGLPESVIDWALGVES